jgi:hypothetical protein
MLPDALALFAGSPTKNLFFRFPAIVEVNDVSHTRTRPESYPRCLLALTTQPAPNSSRTLTSRPGRRRKLAARSPVSRRV